MGVSKPLVRYYCTHSSLSVGVALLHARFLKRGLGGRLVGRQAGEPPGCGSGQSRGLRQRRICVRRHVAGGTCRAGVGVGLEAVGVLALVGDGRCRRRVLVLVELRRCRR